MGKIEGKNGKSLNLILYSLCGFGEVVKSGT